jgi:hypothetical protein
VGRYLELARNAVGQEPVERRKTTLVTRGHLRRAKEINNELATKATEATKAPAPSATTRDQSDRSNERYSVRILTFREVLAEISCPDSGPAKNAELYRRGELSEEKAVEYVACAILNRRGSGFEGWRAHAPTVRAALTHPIGCGCVECA